MARARNILSLAFALVSLSGASAALARCDGAAQTARIHDAYRAVLAESGDGRNFAGVTLFTLLPDIDASELAHALEQDGARADLERLVRLLKQARSLANDAMIGLALPEAPGTHHGTNVDWLAALVAETGCAERWAGAAGGASQRSVVQPSEFRGGIDLPVILGIICAATLVFVGARIRKSRGFRIRQAARLPRHATALRCEVKYLDQGRMTQTSVIGLDISAGGMKLAWETPLAKGRSLDLILPGGTKSASVVWANSFYAGVMFDELIDEAELANLVSISSPRTASKLGAI